MTEIAAEAVMQARSAHRRKPFGAPDQRHLTEPVSNARAVPIHPASRPEPALMRAAAISFRRRLMRAVVEGRVHQHMIEGAGRNAGFRKVGIGFRIERDGACALRKSVACDILVARARTSRHRSRSALRRCPGTRESRARLAAPTPAPSSSTRSPGPVPARGGEQDRRRGRSGGRALAEAGAAARSGSRRR